MKQLAYTLITITLVTYILIIGKGILIPFLFALLFWFLTRIIRKALYKLPAAKKYLPYWASNIIVFFVILIAITFAADLILNNIDDLSRSFHASKPNIEKLENSINSLLGINLSNTINTYIGQFDYTSILGNIAGGISGLMGNFFMIILYALFVFLEESSFASKMGTMFSTPDNFARFENIMSKIESSISSYLTLKTFVSILTGVLSYIVLLVVGVDAAAFWAFLIFLLNFVPTVGSLIATVFPAVYSLIQFGTWTPFLVVLIGVGVVQLIIGNVVEPRLFGKSLNVSPLVTILALAIWGQIWGITGMVLSVPIMVIMVICFSQFESTRNIAILLSEKGEVD